ncbi:MULTISPECIES: hypothetical protein [unclassified Massilia]|uniref:hypothetical protein n=1 Tax=unclassified Massilia TaxID=2609279 RepID=UPI00177C8BB8|nr:MULTISPECIES: hypothetical protein [unclassified Massilia]MBD8531699.1 hypothetical protein [Massilia sp. CFBP 13647]MBD8675144.1 hypothetical protein [Massilia sp. CFBP 13721]
MNRAKLADLYESNPTVRAILDMLGERTNNSKVSFAKRIHFLLKQRGIVVKYGELIAAFRLLQEAGCGIFVRGSKGYSSRFDWAVKTTLVADFARDAMGEEEDDENDEEDDEEDGEDEDEEDDRDLTVKLATRTVCHSFLLRLDLRIPLRLPPSLNQTEADRLAQFVESLSFTDPFEDEEDEGEEYDDEEIEHSYVLRPAERVTLELPADLTPREAIRLAQFIRALPFS